jgi:phytoene dehydrogenase-like protein
MRASYDAIVVGSGPNGLAAGIRLAEHGFSVLMVEARPMVGGGSRSEQRTLPGFVHDVCAAIHPLASSSPFMKRLPLSQQGLEFVHAPVPLAHPLDDGRAAVLDRSVEETAAGLGPDGKTYQRLMRPLVSRWDEIAKQVLGPVRLPAHPLLLARFALRGVRSASRLAEGLFQSEPARALFAGLSGHSMLPLNRPLTAAFGLLFGASGHAVGWPLARGGSQFIADALASHFRTLGGQIITGKLIENIDELPKARAILFDVTPRQLIAIAGTRLPSPYLRRLKRFRYGPGVFKLDLALDGPIPWKAPECGRAGTIHLGGTLADIAASEATVGRRDHPERPYVLLAQPSLFDRSRAPTGKHTVWAYCHVPNGSAFDMSERIERQIERFAPGFRDRILARAAMSPSELERYNPNYIGGDISGGAHDGLQLLARPTLSWMPYATPAKGIFICSSSTPPGAGVHGMCGFHAAQAALKYLKSGRRQSI